MSLVLSLTVKFLEKIIKSKLIKNYKVKPKTNEIFRISVNTDPVI